MPHIVWIKKDTAGEDFIGTDPHGCLDVLKKAFELLGPNDRFHLCGDLIDRGPESLGVIRYIKEQQAAGKKIYSVRGNHEDMALKALNFLDIYEALSTRKTDQEAWLDFKSLRSNQWLDFVDDNTLDNFYMMQCTLFQLASDFVYQQNDPLEHFSEFIQDLKDMFSSRSVLESQFIRNFFNFALDSIGNGGAWILELSKNERAEVVEFIDALPYIIRVADSFDIVHAAPLSEKRLMELEKSENPELTAEEIAYITWAKPAALCRPNERFIIQSNGRTPRSIRTYVGHCVLSAHLEDYQNINVMVLDTDTVHTARMFIVSHTRNIILTPETKEEGIEPHVVKDYYKALNALMDFTNPSSIRVIGKIYNEIYLKTSPKIKKSEEDFSSEELKSFKRRFLTALKHRSKTLQPMQPEALIRFLLENNNVLSRKRNVSSSETELFSHTTQSMREALQILSKKVLSTEIAVKISFWGRGQVTVFNENNNSCQNNDIKMVYEF